MKKSIPDIAVVLTDNSRKIVWVNSSFTDMTGYELPEVIGKKPSILQGINSQAEVIIRIRRKLDSQNPRPFKDEIINYRKSGEEYPCRFVIHPIFSEAGELSNFIAFEIDATDIDDDSHIPLMQLKAETSLRYVNSPLTDKKELELFSKLLMIVENEKLYLDPKLKMSRLAERLKTNTRYLSQVVNNQTGENLTQFINRYRVEETKLKILDESLSYLTTFAIANMCGFNTKSTFYKCFKEITGITPKEYVKSVKEAIPHE